MWFVAGLITGVILAVAGFIIAAICGAGNEGRVDAEPPPPSTVTAGQPSVWRTHTLSSPNGTTHLRNGGAA